MNHLKQNLLSYLATALLALSLFGLKQAGNAVELIKKLKNQETQAPLEVKLGGRFLTNLCDNVAGETADATTTMVSMANGTTTVPYNGVFTANQGTSTLICQTPQASSIDLLVMAKASATPANLIYTQ